MLMFLIKTRHRRHVVSHHQIWKPEPELIRGQPRREEATSPLKQMCPTCGVPVLGISSKEKRKIKVLSIVYKMKDIWREFGHPFLSSSEYRRRRDSFYPSDPQTLYFPLTQPSHLRSYQPEASCSSYSECHCVISVSRWRNRVPQV